MNNRTLACCLCACAAYAQQPPALVQKRDLTPVRIGTAEELKLPVRVPRGYAVVIGISNYKNLGDKSNLAYAEKDAENIYATLIGKEAGNIEFENVRKLIGPQATLANIKEALEVWLPSHATSTDRAVVFFVGHGVTDPKGRGYIAPYDIDPRSLDTTAYSMERLGEVLSKQVKAQWKMLLTDACHSGKIPINTTASQVNESLRNLPQGFLTLTSSRASEQSFEDAALAGGNGIFSYFLARGWQGEADVDPADGVVTADELVTYVKREVRAYARSRGTQQTPLEFGDFPDNLVLGFDSGRRQQIAASLPELINGSLIVEVNLDEVEVYVDGKRYGTANPSSRIRIPGLSSGAHQVRGVRLGYEPVSVDVNLVPGGTLTVSLRLLRQRTIKPSAKAFLDQADSLWQRSRASPSDLAKAGELYSKALKEDSNESRADLGLCRVQHAQGKADSALKSCLRAVETDADFDEARTMTAVLYMENGDYPQAVRQAQAAAAQNPKSSFVQSILAEALFLADRPTEAEQTAARALELDSSSGQAYLIRGEARRAQQKFDDAIEDYTRAIRVQEFGSSALRVTAFWAVGMGVTKHRNGVQFLYRSQKAAALHGLCAAELGRQNFLRAVRYCNDSLSLEPDDPATHQLLAECYASLFTHDNRREYLIKAKENVEATLRTNPDIEGATVLRRKLAEIRELLQVVNQ